VASKRRRKTRTKTTSSLPPIVVSALSANCIDLTPGKEHLACPDCGTWCPVTGMQGTPKLVPHHTERAGTSNPHRCGSSNRLVTVDVEIGVWHAELIEATPTTASRRATKVLRKPKTPRPPAINTMTPAPLTAEASRVMFRRHQERCAACAGHATSRTGELLPCPDGERLAVTYLRLMRQEPRRLKMREFFARERSRFDRQYAAQARKGQADQWAKSTPAARNTVAKRSGTAVEEANNTRQTIRPGAVSELRGVDVPLTPPAREPHPAPTGPTCTRCSTTETDLDHAVAAGWQLVRRRLHCGPCASGFPAWMTTQI
jgi:hypothetical protein